MSKRLLTLVSFSLATSAVWGSGKPASTATPSQPDACAPHKSAYSRYSKTNKVYDLACATYSAQVIKGPRTVVAENLNVLRYDYKWSSTASYQAAPDVWAKLMSASSTVPATPAPTDTKVPPKTGVAVAATPPPDIKALIDKATSVIADTQAQIRPIEDLKDEIQNDIAELQTQQNLASTAQSKVTVAGKSLVDFLKTGTGTPEQIIGGITDLQVPDGPFDAGIKARGQWADPNSVSRLDSSSHARTNKLDDFKSRIAVYVTQQAAALESLKSDLNLLASTLEKDKAQTPDELKMKKALISDAVGRLTAEQGNLTAALVMLGWDITVNSQIIAAIPDLSLSGTKYASFVDAGNALVTWNSKMRRLKQQWTAYSTAPTTEIDPFDMAISSDCEFAFSQTKQNAIVLSRTDQLPGSTASSSETVLSVSVECTSPFTVSAGVAFSTLPVRQFSIQPVAVPANSTTTVNEFTYTVAPSYHPLPIAMAHARLWEPYGWLAFDVSVGVSASVQNQNAGGSSPGYLIAPSVSLFRTMFFSPGLYLGNEARLGAGYKIGDVAPSNVTAPPIQTSYTKGFGFAITFTKP